jgi:hypothetical protein
MEDENIFKNAGKPWTKEEDEQLNKLYNEDMLDIIEICKIHERERGGIISRLIKNNIIDDKSSVRGYNSYKKKTLYNQNMDNNNVNDKIITDEKINKRVNKSIDNKDTLIKNILIDINKNDYIKIKNDYIELKNDIKDMKNEINDLKNNIKILVDIIKKVYHVEDL